MQKIDIQLIPLNGGRFISRGRGTHPTRKIDSDELIYVIHGQLDIFEEKQLFSLHAGEWIILKKKHRHGGLSDYSKDLSFFWVHFIDENGFLEQISQTGKVGHEEALTNYFQSFINEQEFENSDIESQKLLMLLIFRELQRSKEIKNQIGNSSPLAETAHNLIKLRYTEALTVEHISQELKCNAEYLGRIYKFHYGKSILKEINDLRIAYAARLLSTSTLSIKEIIFRSGFNTPVYFRRCFIRTYAMTPIKFRRKYISGHVNSD